ncbi:hypothetical protein BJ508DRAFT_76431 [Ascobolus immersus RN42]|uniref:Uncharacterized protein n=1 Tax=Ascobolus immersus RN42 TaxID=1160509 RepID=A0A3N4HDD5_ASCIM|nr:hypothetical protein BJ508DRAFT_76431 [Ascobolus immersus RN42]
MGITLPFLTPRAPTKSHSRNTSVSTLYTPPIPHARDIPDPDIFRYLPPARRSHSSETSSTPSKTSSDKSDTSTLAPSTVPSVPPPQHPHDLIPNLSELTVHLELLGCIAELRRKVENCSDSDFALGLNAIFLSQHEHTADQLRLERWKRFLVIAAARWEVWFKAWGAGGCEWSTSTIPPLEVLAIWHAFLLNPRCYRQYCNGVFGEELGETVWAASAFRWRIIHDLIDNYTFTYHHPSAARRSFEAMTAHPADIFAQLTASTVDLTTAYTYTVYMPANGKHLLRTTSYLWPKTTFSTPLEASADEETIHLSLASTPFPTHLSASPAVTDKAASTYIHLPLAVLRQGVYIHSIHTHNLLIRSPSLSHTLTTGRRQFARFFTLIAKFPGTIFVPTPVVDLVWHTLLLDPVRYESYCLISTAGHRVITRTPLDCFKGFAKMYIGRKHENGIGRFINHDDSLPEEGLVEGRDCTRLAYRRVWWKDWLKRKMGGEGLTWGGCCCWGCEANKMGGEDTDGMVKAWKRVEHERRKELGLI